MRVGTSKRCKNEGGGGGGGGETALLLDKRKILERVCINPINTGLFELLLLIDSI